MGRTALDEKAHIQHMPTKSTSKVTLLKVHNAFKPEKSEDSQDYYSGFSERLNKLIDMARIEDMPAIGEGRMAALAKLVNVSKPATRPWLMEDTPPRDAQSRGAVVSKVTLQSLTALFLKFVPDAKGVDVKKLCVWLKHGDDTAVNPFELLRTADKLPLATSLLTEIAKSSRVSLEGMDLNALVAEVSGILTVYGITRSEDVQPVHKDLILLILKNAIR